MKETYRYIAASLAVFVLLTISGALLMRAPQLKEKMQAIACTAGEPPDSDYYLGYYNGSTDHLSVFHNLQGAAERLLEADVLFLGNSHLLYAIDHEEMRNFERRTALRCYVMAFAYGEQYGFASRLIDRYDLHPRVVVVNTDPFFGGGDSKMAEKTVRSTVWEAWKSIFETNSGLTAHKILHRVYPRMVEPACNAVYYRCRSDGTIFVSATRGKPAKVDETVWKWGFCLDDIRRFSGFLSSMKTRGSSVVLTTVPPCITEPMVELARTTSTPYIKAQVANLSTFDGSHLTPDSAKAFSKRFFDELEKKIRDTARMADRNKTQF